MKIYIAGKITGYDDYKQDFAKAEEKLIKAGHTVMNPTILPEGFEYDDYIKICLAMVSVCDGIFLLDNWNDSRGARLEKIVAETTGKKIINSYSDI